MSNPTAIGLLLAVTITVYTVGMWVTRLANDRADEILSGVVKGLPVPAKTRWLMLVTQYFPYYTFLVAFLLITAVGNMAIATNVDDPRIRLLAYMFASFLAMGAVFWAILGTSWLLHIWSALRQAEAD